MFKDFNECSPEEQFKVIQKWYLENKNSSNVPQEKLREFFKDINVRVLISKYISEYKVLENLLEFKEKYESFN